MQELEVKSALVSFRQETGAEKASLDWRAVGADSLMAASPWRTFRWYIGQKHYSGTYWSSTVCDHVIYESRLELTRLLFADFDPQVEGIVAQPFLLEAEIDSVVRRHIPDYLLLTSGGPVVVDVKPKHRLERPAVAFAFAWTRELVEARGWSYEVWTEPDSVELANVRFLAGYRRTWLLNEDLIAELRTADLVGATLAEAFASLPGRPGPLVRAAVLGLVWSRWWTLDLVRPLSGRTVLGAGR